MPFHAIPHPIPCHGCHPPQTAILNRPKCAAAGPACPSTAAVPSTTSSRQNLNSPQAHPSQKKNRNSRSNTKHAHTSSLPSLSDGIIRLPSLLLRPLLSRPQKTFHTTDVTQGHMHTQPNPPGPAGGGGNLTHTTDGGVANKHRGKGKAKLQRGSPLLPPRRAKGEVGWQG